MRIALTREISPSIDRCELTHLTRRPIDVVVARRQHDAYEQALASAGCSVVRLEAGENMPDSVFIEDVALVFEELAIITRPGAESRRIETAAVAERLSAYRPITTIAPPGTIDGGDALTVGKHVFVGESRRTNADAIAQVAGFLAPHGYTVQVIPVGEVLHLKSAVTSIDDETLLINPAWVRAEYFRPLRILEVHPDEPYGANALRVGPFVIYPSAFPRTQTRLEAHGVRLSTVDVGELTKAEGAVTCCSLIFMI